MKSLVYQGGSREKPLAVPTVAPAIGTAVLGGDATAVRPENVA